LSSWDFVKSIIMVFLAGQGCPIGWPGGAVQGILKGEVSLYSWPPVWLVWISLFCK